MNIRQNNYKVKCKKCEKHVPKNEANHWHGKWTCNRCRGKKV